MRAWRLHEPSPKCGWGVRPHPNWRGKLALKSKDNLLSRGDASWAVMVEEARSSLGWKLLYEDDLSVLIEAVAAER